MNSRVTQTGVSCPWQLLELSGMENPPAESRPRTQQGFAGEIKFTFLWLMKNSQDIRMHQTFIGKTSQPDHQKYFSWMEIPGSVLWRVNVHWGHQHRLVPPRKCFNTRELMAALKYLTVISHKAVAVYNNIETGAAKCHGLWEKEGANFWFLE